MKENMLIWNDLRDDCGGDVRPIQSEIEQADASFAGTKEVDLVVIRSKPAKRCQNGQHLEDKFREKLPGEGRECDDVEDLGHISQLQSLVGRTREVLTPATRTSGTYLHLVLCYDRV